MGFIPEVKIGNSTYEIKDRNTRDLNAVLEDAAGTLFNKIEIPQYNATAGWKIGEDGYAHDAPGYQIIKYRMHQKGTIVVTSDDYFQFQNAANVPSSGNLPRIGRTYGKGTYALAIPEEAEYLVVSTPISESAAKVYISSNEKTFDPVYHDAYATQIVSIGPAKQNTIIDQNTGGEKVGSGTGNNWCTADMIPLPKTTIYLKSYAPIYGIIGYDASKNYIGHIHGDSNFIVGTFSFDNAQYNFDYVRFNLYHQNGYSEDRHKQLQVYYHTDNEPNDFIGKQKWIFKSINTDSSGYPEIVDSTKRIIVSSVQHANKGVQIIRKGDSPYLYGVYLLDEDGKKVFAEWMTQPETDVATVIPKGVDYILGFGRVDDSDELSMEEILYELKDSIRIYELEDDEPGIFSFYADGHVYRSEMGRTGLTQILRANDNLLLKCEDGYTSSIEFFTTGSGAPSKWRGAYSVTEYLIPDGSYYRYTVGPIDYEHHRITEDTKAEVFAKAKITPLEIEKNRIAKQVNGLQEMLSLTMARVAELEKASNINLVPLYWQDHLDGKIEAINTLRSNEDNCDQFVFITDVHINGYVRAGGRGNQKHSHALLNHLCKNTAVDKIFNGGDLYNSGTGMTKPEAVNSIREAIAYTVPDYNCRHYFVLGNHDTGYDWPDGTQYTSDITPEDVYLNVGNDSKLLSVQSDFKSRSNFYFDEGKFRYIVSNMGLNGFTGETNGYSWAFVADAMKSAGDKQIVIIQHVMWQSRTDVNFDYRGQAIADLADAYNARGIGSFEPSANATRDFSDCTGRVVCIITGHIHMDRSVYTAGGIPVIATTTDNAEGEAPETYNSRDNYIGTINEQAFDVFTIDLQNNKVYATRIGFGQDRNFDIPSVS